MKLEREEIGPGVTHFPVYFDVVLPGSSQMQDSLNWFLDSSQSQLIYVLLLHDCSRERRIWGFLPCHLADITLSFENSAWGTKLSFDPHSSPSSMPGVCTLVLSGAECKYFQLCFLYSATQHCSLKSTHKQYVKEWTWLHSNWTIFKISWWWAGCSLLTLDPCPTQLRDQAKAQARSHHWSAPRTPESTFRSKQSKGFAATTLVTTYLLPLKKKKFLATQHVRS